jgi:ABC-type spermidine/putrescine transport system permease subunit I
MAQCAGSIPPSSRRPRGWAHQLAHLLAHLHPADAERHFAGSVLVFVLSLGFSPALLGGGRVIMIAVLIERRCARQNWPFAAALSAVLLAFTFAVYALAQRVARSEATT